MLKPKQMFFVCGFYIIAQIYLRISRKSFRDTAKSWEISYPKFDENLHDYLKRYSTSNKLPIYVFYPVGSTGQLNNQIMALINALCISKAINATLVVAPVHHGEESNRDWYKRQSMMGIALRSTKNILSRFFMFDYFYPKSSESLLGDYFDPVLIKQLQPIVTREEFIRMRSGIVLKKLPKILVRKGEARDYFDSFQRKISITGQIEADESENNNQKIFSRKELDCNFDIKPIFQGVQYRAGINQNFVFLPRIFRSHLLNCTKFGDHWLHARSYLQPHPRIRQIFETERSKWGTYLAIHLRFKPSDEMVIEPSLFLKMLVQNYLSTIEAVEHVYVAFSPSSEASTIIVDQMRSFFGSRKIITAAHFLKSNSDENVLNFKYSVTLLDMWSCVKSTYFIGREASSLSMNVIYWRESLADIDSYDTRNHYQIYKRNDFTKFS